MKFFAIAVCLFLIFALFGPDLSETSGEKVDKIYEKVWTAEFAGDICRTSKDAKTRLGETQIGSYTFETITTEEIQAYSDASNSLSALLKPMWMGNPLLDHQLYFSTEQNLKYAIAFETYLACHNEKYQATPEAIKRRVMKYAMTKYLIAHDGSGTPFLVDVLEDEFKRLAVLGRNIEKHICQANSHRTDLSCG